jgi:hypothetical protein
MLGSRRDRRPRSPHALDESSVAYRTKHDPVSGGQGRSHDGKMLVAGAVECIHGGKAGRVRLAVIPDYTADTLKRFVVESTSDGSTILTDGFSSCQGMKGRKYLPKTVGAMAAHVLLPWVHRVFSNLKRLGLGVYHGFRRAHLQAYLDEFVFRWNRRRHYRLAFDILLGIGLRTAPTDYWALIGRRRRAVYLDPRAVCRVDRHTLHVFSLAAFCDSLKPRDCDRRVGFI